MVILIDAYNLLKSVLKSNFIDEKQRNWFISIIKKYSLKKKNNIIIVFDGGPYDRPTFEMRGSCSIVYSGRHQSADIFIKNYIEDQNSRGQANMLIVSSDRGLQKIGKNLGVSSVESELFYDLIKETQTQYSNNQIRLLKAPGAAKKLNKDLKDSPLDILMQEASNTLMYKHEDEIRDNTIKRMDKLSKSEKEKLKILKKL